MQVVILYLCWIPLNAVLLVDDLVGGLHMRITFFPLMFTVCHLVAMSSAVSNPVMYGFMNGNFVREARALLFCGSERDRIRRSSVNTTGTTMGRSCIVRGSASCADTNGDAIRMSARSELTACDSGGKEDPNKKGFLIEKSGGGSKRINDVKRDQKCYLALPAADGDRETEAIALEDISSSPPTPTSAVETNSPRNGCRKTNHLAASNNYCTNNINTLQKPEANN